MRERLDVATQQDARNGQLEGLFAIKLSLGDNSHMIIFIR